MTLGRIIYVVLLPVEVRRGFAFVGGRGFTFVQVGPTLMWYIDVSGRRAETRR